MPTIHGNVHTQAVPKFILFNDSDNDSHGVYATKSENIQSIYVIDNITIDIYIRNPSGGYAAAATTTTNAFAATDGTVTDSTINIDGIAITIPVARTAEQIADVVSKTTFTNYIATLQGNQVLFTKKVKGTAGNVAITMSDAQYTKAGAATHTVTAADFTGGSDAYGNASDDKIRITTLTGSSYRVFTDILNNIATTDTTYVEINDSMDYISNIDYIAGT